MSKSEFSAREKRECAEREAKKRREVYGRKSGEVLTSFQRRQIALMEEIAEDYRAKEGAENNDLFGG